MKLGSLFDGSGGFPLAARMCGIEPVWASEIEEYPIRVTKKNFPNMKHLGDITKINGAEIEPVDIITFGSPCQDLSIAGNRAGMKHTEQGDDETTRSGLFYEAIRVIKEMRDATQGRYPTFIIWENVFGAFSSNNGDDFWAVLNTIGGIAEDKFCTPRLEKWTYAGEILADGFSIAYRTLDLQYWVAPKCAVASSLWQILEDNVQEKYYLSGKACRGILRRSEKNGKKLPPILEQALLLQSKSDAENPEGGKES